MAAAYRGHENMTETEKQFALEVWNLMQSAYIEGKQPDEIKRSRAYVALDRKLRAEGVLPKVG